MREIHKRDKNLHYLLPPQQLKNQLYKRSQFVYTMRENGRYYLFNTLTKQCFEADADIPKGEISAESIKNDSALKQLTEEFFIVPADLNECENYENIIDLLRAMQKKRGYTYYTILPTTACNARCVYCFEEGFKQVSLTDELTDKLCDFILKNRRKDSKITLEWFGGEPMLGSKRIDYISSRLKDEGVEFESNMISNGSLFNDELIEKAKNLWNLKSVQISMDGSESEYIRRKRYIKNDDEYHKVLENIKKLTSNGIFVTIRCNVDKDNISTVDEYIDDIDNAFKDRKNISAYFVPLNEERTGDNCMKIWEECIKADDELESRGFSISSIRDQVLKLKINRCKADTPASSVVIAPDGKLYCCDECVEGMAYGDIENGVTSKENIEFFENYGGTREKCAGCVFLPECTSFSKCPIVDKDCVNLIDIFQKRILKSIID